MVYFLIFLFLFSCKEQEYNDYNPIAPSICEYEDITGTCCSEEELDCNNICNGNSAMNCNNACVSIALVGFYLTKRDLILLHIGKKTIPSLYS